MRLLALLPGIALIILFLLDAFETILQPRRVTHRFRFARLFYRTNWAIWRNAAGCFPLPKQREAFLSTFGPLSLIGLFITWVAGLILGFALVQYSLSTPLIVADRPITFFTYLYMSGTTFFTLGFGDVTPTQVFGRTLAVVESGLGFGFLAVIISYLPVLAQAFSKREVTISLLDARAGSPPSAGQLLLRLAGAGNIAEVSAFLTEWEQWSAELLESHLSFPVLGFYRSQHNNQSWLAALTTMLDTCAVLMAVIKDVNPYRAQLTFAMARHSAVDLSLILRTAPASPAHDRLPGEKLKQLQQALAAAGLHLHEEEGVAAKLSQLRGMYEPFVNALAGRFVLELPPFFTDEKAIDNWQRSPGARAPGLENLPIVKSSDDHF
jgi:hypothetical protein